MDFKNSKILVQRIWMSKHRPETHWIHLGLTAWHLLPVDLVELWPPWPLTPTDPWSSSLCETVDLHHNMNMWRSENWLPGLNHLDYLLLIYCLLVIISPYLHPQSLWIQLVELSACHWVVLEYSSALKYLYPVLAKLFRRWTTRDMFLDRMAKLLCV